MADSLQFAVLTLTTALREAYRLLHTHRRADHETRRRLNEAWMAARALEVELSQSTTRLASAERLANDLRFKLAAAIEEEAAADTPQPASTGRRIRLKEDDE